MDSKSTQAALMAQELASEGSWANSFISAPTTSTTTSPEDATTTTINPEPRQPPSDAPPAYESVAKMEPVELPATPLQPSPTLLRSSSNTIDPSDSAFLMQQLDPTRCYSRHERHGSISGTFTFFDFLELTTDHGSITITLDPRPGDRPAILRLTATHGAIQVKLSDNYLEHLNTSGKLSRPWDATIRAKSGAVDAKLPIGQGSKFFLKSRWGAVTSTFYIADPGQSDEASDVKVETHNGAQSIKFQSLQGMYPVTNISGDYHSKMGGGIKVVYPQTWEGRIQAKSVRGKVKVEGNSLQTQHYGKNEIHVSRGVAQQITLLRSDGHGRAKVEC